MLPGNLLLGLRVAVCLPGASTCFLSRRLCPRFPGIGLRLLLALLFLLLFGLLLLVLLSRLLARGRRCADAKSQRGADHGSQCSTVDGGIDVHGDPRHCGRTSGPCSGCTTRQIHLTTSECFQTHSASG
jgi:hypothetical protein